MKAPETVVVTVPRGLQFRRAGELEVRSPTWLVRDLLEADTLACLYGQSGDAKTFTAVELSCCVATGKDFDGRSVRPGTVAYICGEGNAGFARRLKAWELHQGIGLQDAPLYVSAGPVNLLDDAERIVSGIEQIGGADLVVIDTLARCFGSGDENSTQDMGRAVAACDEIRHRFGCTVLIVHHTGHSEKNRARGSVALRAAMDAEYRQTRNADGVIRLECTKMKDAEPSPPMTFELRQVGLGIYDDGREVSGAVLTGAESAPTRPKLTTCQREAIEALRAACNGDDVCHSDDWRQAFYERRDGSPDAKRKGFKRATDQLLDAGIVAGVGIDTYRLTEEPIP